MDHPIVKEIERHGYPLSHKEPKLLFLDALGNNVYEGDEVLEFDDEIYVVEELSSDAIEILERHGASRRVIDG